MPSVQAAVGWMPEHKGLIMGWIVGMLGFAGAIWNWIVDTIINPDSLQPSGPPSDKIFPREIAERIPELIRILFCIHFVCALITITFVFKKHVPLPA